MSNRRKNYNVVIFDSSGKLLKRAILTDGKLPRLPLTRTKRVEIYYGTTLKEAFEFVRVRAKSSDKKLTILASVQGIEKKRVAKAKKRKERGAAKELVSENYRLYDKNKRVLSPTNFRAAKYFAIFAGRKKIFFSYFGNVKTRQQKQKKIREWRHEERGASSRPSFLPAFDVETLTKEVKSRDGESLRLRIHYALYKNPVVIPHQNKVKLTQFLSYLKEDVKKVFMREWAQSSGTERRFIFKVFTPMYNEQGELVSQGAHYIEDTKGEKALTFDRLRNNFSYGYSNARVTLTSVSEFDLAWNDLVSRWVRMMEEYISRSAAAFMNTIGFLVENVL